MARARRLLLTCLLLATGLAAAADVPTFARIVNDDDGRPAALQLAVVGYRAANGARVELVSAIHIGEREYYATLNEYFTRYDALLYELVAPEDGAIPAPGGERDGFISGTQIAMTAALGLAFQLDEIDYAAENFVHADLSPERLRAAMQERGESLYVYFWRLFFAAIDDYARDPLGLRSIDLYSALLSNDDNALKIAIARELVDVDRHRRFLAGESGSAVIEARNERAMDVLRDTLAGGATDIGIFYGVAHMPDFHERLVDEFGMAVTGTRWLDAWRLDGGK